MPNSFFRITKCTAVKKKLKKNWKELRKTKNKVKMSWKKIKNKSMWKWAKRKLKKYDGYELLSYCLTALCWYKYEDFEQQSYDKIPKTMLLFLI